MPGRLKINDEVVGVHWVGSIMIGEKNRGKGMLFVKYMVEHNPFKLGFPVNDRVGMLYLRFGGDHLLQTEQYFFLNHAGKWLASKKPQLRLIAPVIDFLWKIFLNASLFLQSVVSDLHVKEIAEFDDSFDLLWQDVCESYQVITVRDKDYLNWRFLRCPLHQYRIYAAYRNNRLAGYVVTRLGDKKTLKQGYIVDVLVKNGDLHCFKSLLMAAVRNLRKDGADFISMMKVENCLWVESTLRKQGFLFSKPHVKLVGSAKSHCKNQLFPASENDCWFTYSDSDNDLSL